MTPYDTLRRPPSLPMMTPAIPTTPYDTLRHPPYPPAIPTHDDTYLPHHTLLYLPTPLPLLSPTPIIPAHSAYY